jgi:4-amino-4-deoxy-L-arabinose transferase-like glycosyltransferase
MNQSDTSIIRRQNSYLWLCGVVTLLFAGLLVYSQTQALAWDEGFHLLAAQLIKAGKRPYLDFCFPQTPLNAYWNAGWMRILGDSWRVVHAFAALFTAGAIMLAADFVFVRFPVPSWRLAAALTAALVIGLNVLIVQFGTVGQAYGMCLFLIVASFRVSILAAERKAALWAGLAGFLAAAAAGSSLLTAPVGPVLLLWILIYNRIGSRPRKFAAFALATAIAIVPLLLLLAKGPHQVMFNIIEYHLFYRSVGWEGAQHDLEVLTSWVNSTQALLLGLLAAAGVLFAVKSRQDRQWREELYLCCWLAVALGLYISSTHPTFEPYFVLMVPFLGVLAAVGLYAIVSRLDIQGRRLLPIVGLTALLCLGLAKALYERRDDYSWQDLEEIARKVEQVTPPQELLLADEHIYFLTHHTPPSGMEFPDSQKLNLPADVAASLHIVPRTELAKRVQAGMFHTVETCDDEDDERILILHLPHVYARKAVIHECRIFWDTSPRYGRTGIRDSSIPPSPKTGAAAISGSASMFAE